MSVAGLQCHAIQTGPNMVAVSSKNICKWPTRDFYSAAILKSRNSQTWNFKRALSHNKTPTGVYSGYS